MNLEIEGGRENDTVGHTRRIWLRLVGFGAREKGRETGQRRRCWQKGKLIFFLGFLFLFIFIFIFNLFIFASASEANRE